MVSDEAVRAARAEGMLPLVRMFSGWVEAEAQPRVAIPGINPDSWTMQARTAIRTGFLPENPSTKKLSRWSRL